MASLTSTSGGKIPVDSTETAQRHKSAQLQRSFSRHLAPGPLSLVFPLHTSDKPDLHSQRRGYICQQEAQTHSIPKQYQTTTSVVTH